MAASPELRIRDGVQPARDDDRHEERRDTEISRSSSSAARSSFWSRDRGASRHGYVPFDLYLVPNLQIGYGSLLNLRQSVAVAYWGMSILAVVYLGFAWRARRRH